MNTSPEKEYDDSPAIIDPTKQSELGQSIEEGTKLNFTFNNKNYELTMGKKLGSGGFGTVYRCTDSSNKEYAIKKITSKANRGVPCLFEASIMCMINHPSLNKCIAVSATLSGIYILMDQAKFDLHGLLRHNQLNKIRMNMAEYRNILFRVAQGVSYLHQKGLVHGDIKCSNILYYSETDIRITDFNLTTMKKWKSNIHLCTAIYRPFEIWMEKNWSDRIDVWCFGCVMYELLYDQMLFKYQGDVTVNNTRKMVKKKYVNALIDWANFNSPGKLNLSKYQIKYEKCVINQELIIRKAGVIREYDPERETYINLMLRCLQILDKDRPHIDTVISDQFFSNIRNRPDIKSLFNLPRDSPTPINKNLHDIIAKSIVNHTGPDDKELLRLATDICSTYVQICKFDTHLIKKVSVWIARKLIRSDIKSQEVPNDGKVSKDEMLTTEIDICNKLGFKLHSF